MTVSKALAASSGGYLYFFSNRFIILRIPALADSFFCQSMLVIS